MAKLLWVIVSLALLSVALASKSEKKYEKVKKKYVKKCGDFCVENDRKKCVKLMKKLYEAAATASVDMARECCIKKDFDYQGADLERVGGVPNVDVCLEACAGKADCKSVAYQASSKNCWLKYKLVGANPGKKVGVDSANLFCFAHRRSLFEKCKRDKYDFWGADLTRLSNIGSLKECAGKCENVDRCVSVTYAPASKYCWLKKRVEGLRGGYNANVQSINIACASGYGDKLNDNDICVLKEYDYEGADIKKLSGVSDIQSCLANCAKEPGCKSVAFVPARKDCWLKYKLYGASPKDKAGVQSANLFCYAKRRPENFEKCKRDKYDFWGADLTRLSNIGSLKECAGKCENVDRCVSVTYAPASKYCWLKKRVEGLRGGYNANVQSINIACASGYGSNLSSQDICVLKNYDYEGADIKKVSGIPNIHSCLQSCTKEPKCKSVAYVPSRKDCWLKYRIYGASPKDKAGVESANLFCFADKNKSQNQDKCVRKKFDFWGADVERFVNVGSLWDCYGKCRGRDNCVSVTYVAAAKHCYTKFKVEGDRPQSKDSCESVNVACLSGI